MQRLHQYRWFSNIKWGPSYSPEHGCHFASASDVETLRKHYGSIDIASLQIQWGNAWRWVEDVAKHNGGTARHWHGEPF